MTIAITDLVTNLNSDLGRAETSTTILRWLKETLRDLCIRIPALKKSTNFTLVAGQESYTQTQMSATDLRDVISIRLHDGTDYKEPLDRFTSWNRYLRDKAGQVVASRAEPLKYIFYQENLYLDPTPDALKTYVAYLEYTAISVVTDEIELADKYENALYHGLCFFYLVAKGLATSEKGKTYGQLYLDDCTNLAGIQESREGPKQIEYNDL